MRFGNVLIFVAARLYLLSMKFAHVSDLHFGSRVCGKRLRALCEDLTAQAPQLLVITGDITDSGYSYQFKRSISFLEQSAIPYICVPGNREISPATLWELVPRFSMRRYRSYFGPSDRIIHSDSDHGVVFFGLNSVHPFPSWVGKIYRDTRYWFRENSAKYDGFLKVLFLHHPVLPVMRSSSVWAHSLSDAGELLNICTENSVGLILQGHKHRSAVMEVNFPQRNARVVVSACGSPIVPGWDCVYHMIQIRDSRISVNTREYIQDKFVTSGDYRFD